jgi:hypothetical protein
MGHKNDVSSQQVGGSYIFDDVVVVAYQDPALPAAKIKYTILISRRQMGIDEGMQFAILCYQPIAVNTHIGLVQFVVGIFFK